MSRHGAVGMLGWQGLGFTLFVAEVMHEEGEHYCTRCVLVHHLDPSQPRRPSWPHRPSRPHRHHDPIPRHKVGSVCSSTQPPQPAAIYGTAAGRGRWDSRPARPMGQPSGEADGDQTSNGTKLWKPPYAAAN